MQSRRIFVCLALILISVSSFAQQTGSVSGTVTSGGDSLPGVTIEARSPVLPQARVTTTELSGEYRLPVLPPGSYTLTYSLSGMQTVTRNFQVLLNQNATVDVSLGVAGIAETITVTADATLVSRQSTQIESGISQREIEALPITQNYSDLQKLIPGVMYTADSVRGPSAGASGQDNVYMFDGVNVTMPLFGVLVAEPNTYDIAQVSVVKGGAKAIDFNRAGGFLIDSVSKSGTNKFAGEVGYQILKRDFIADQTGVQNLTYAQDRNWTTANLGGPIVPDRLYFYSSYYSPEFTRSNQANLYGNLPKFSSERTEYFGKVTYTPLASVLLNGSYRNSHRLDSSGDAFLIRSAPTTGSGSETRLKIATLDGSWVANPRSVFSFRVTDFQNPGFGRSDFLADANVSTTVGTQLDLANLNSIGRLLLPIPLPGNTAQNAFVQPFIDRYGFICPDNPASQGLSCVAGQRTGGGTLGYGEFAQDDDSFFRKSAQIEFDYALGTNISHDLHAGYQRYEDSEDRFQRSNGWGVITIPAGVGVAGTCPASACGTATPAFFVASVSQQTTGVVPSIHSEFHSQNIELNDTIRWNKWSFNVGVLASNDTLYGQGLQEADNVAGFVSSPGTKYKMHEWSFEDMIQPRLGATWAYDGTNTLWTSYATYHPAANSDARAASWDRNLVRNINAYFDASGRLLGFQPNASSSGKLFQDGIKPPKIEEYMIGTARQFTSRWSARLYTRYRNGQDYVEDTNNDARLLYNPPAGIPRELYIPELNDYRAAIGRGTPSGSSYVIANLDGAFTKYYEATLESDWRDNRMTLNGAYTWSHYYGNFDQDNSSFNTANDTSIFIGSSNIADGAGRQLWNFKYGDLRGDRRHVLKLRGTYQLPWHATMGAFALYQSGQPYQLESVLPYRPLTGSTSDTNRFAESAGSRRSPDFYNLDMNYTQNIGLPRGLSLQLVADMFNVFDNQEGYNYETRIGTLGLTTRTDVPTVERPASIPASVLPAGTDPNARVNAPFAKSFYAPRRYQLALRVKF